MTVEFELHGLEEIEDKFKRIDDYKTVRKVVRKSLRAGANVWRDNARKKAKIIDDPLTRENIAKNISTMSGKSKPGTLRMRVGVRGGAKLDISTDAEKGGSTQYWRFIEFGNQNTAAKPFMRPAIAENIETATTSFTNKLNSELDKIIR